MDKKQIQETLSIVKNNASKRNFKQSIDLIVNLQGLDLKKQDNKVDVYAQLHFQRGKKEKICGLVGPELKDSAEKNFDTTIAASDFGKFGDKKKIKKLAKEHTFFVAQANIMPQVATSFGRVLGPRGKMPNPKAGCVVPPNANLQAVAEKLQKTLRIKIEAAPLFQTRVGVEGMEDEHIIDNILTVYKALLNALPNEKHNIHNVLLKTTMGKAIKVGEKAEDIAKKEEEAQKQQEASKEIQKEAAKEAPKKKKVAKKAQKKAEEPAKAEEQPKTEEQSTQKDAESQEEALK